MLQQKGHKSVEFYEEEKRQTPTQAFERKAKAEDGLPCTTFTGKTHKS